jgi:PIN domain nuclease of toxin-antitoxin system
MLAISAEHAHAAGDLPAHHRDPFDRMPIAQAMVERYSIPVIKA